ncbi:MAG: NAD(P) transhydrogenase subunit alpha [Dehalococcoidales bacterium]|nr:NAD(P) transhydrogenase subunit alpha [Dehalococcoidales bacterium]
MIIGIPKEIMPEEGRVALLPQQVRELIQKKQYQVLVEKGAGVKSLAQDSDYEAAGAMIVADVRELYKRSQVIVKVKEPQFNQQLNVNETDLMDSGKILITFIHPAAPSNHNMVRRLSERGITAFTMDGVPRISRAQSMDALSSMSAIAGYKSVLIAANSLPRFVPMMSTAVGMIPPAKVLVIGAGVVGLQAIATAKRLGGVVSHIDIRAAACEAGRSLGSKEVDCEVPKEVAEGEGGYARALPEDWLAKEQLIIAPQAKEADIIILAALVPGERAPILITAETVASLKPGTVIMDVSIDQGGNCELTKPGVEHVTSGGVRINGFQNLPGRMPAHASFLYSKNMANFLLNVFKDDANSLDLNDEINNSSLVTHQGRIFHQGGLKAMAGNK